MQSRAISDTPLWKCQRFLIAEFLYLCRIDSEYVALPVSQHSRCRCFLCFSTRERFAELPRKVPPPSAYSHPIPTRSFLDMGLIWGPWNDAGPGSPEPWYLKSVMEAARQHTAGMFVRIPISLRCRLQEWVVPKIVDMLCLS